MRGIEHVQATYDLRDPMRETICIGGAAVVAQMAEAGIQFNAGDVDTLCSREFSDRIMTGSRGLKGVATIQFGWPNEAASARGATAPGIEIFPNKSAAAVGVLPFTAIESLSDNVYSRLDYETCRAEPERLVVARGITCLRLSEVLNIFAIVGRSKDVSRVRRILPIARILGFLDREKELEISNNLDRSYWGGQESTTESRRSYFI
jgi:hypothetical protein